MNDRRERITHVFAGNPVDRGEVERRDEEWLTAQVNDPASRMLPMWQLNVPVSSDQTLTWLNVDDLRRLRVDAAPIFLGLLDRRSHFVVDVSAAERSDVEKDGLTFEDARTTAEYLSGPESGIVAQARAQLSWHGRHGFCAVCGHPTSIARVDRCAAVVGKRTAAAAPSTTPAPTGGHHRGSRRRTLPAGAVPRAAGGDGAATRLWPGSWIRASASRRPWLVRLWKRPASRSEQSDTTHHSRGPSHRR